MPYRRTQSYSGDIRNQKGKIKIGAPNPKNHLHFCQKQKIKTKCQKNQRKQRKPLETPKFFFANSEKTTLKVVKPTNWKSQYQGFAVASGVKLFKNTDSIRLTWKTTCKHHTLTRWNDRVVTFLNKLCLFSYTGCCNWIIIQWISTVKRRLLH